MKKNDPMPKQQNKKEAKRVHNLIIVDESGSMYVIRKQAFVGMNETLQTVRQMQKKYPDQEQRVTLLTFDSGHTTWHYDNALASRTKNLDWKAYNPGGGTPLYDAIGKGIAKVNAQVEDGDHVLVTIITDGEENSSEEWTLKMVRTMIEKLKKQNWTFTLIGAEEAELDLYAHRHGQPRCRDDGPILCHRGTHGVPAGRGRHQGYVCSRTPQPRTLQLLPRRSCPNAQRQVLRRRLNAGHTL